MELSEDKGGLLFKFRVIKIMLIIRYKMSDIFIVRHMEKK